MMRCPECGKTLTNEEDAYGHDCEAKVCHKHHESYSSTPFGYCCVSCYNEALMKIRKSAKLKKVI
jgi:hypothetical protein